MLFFLSFNLCFTQSVRGPTNVTYTHNENVNDQNIIQMVTSGTGTMFDYRVAYNRNDPVAKICRYNEVTEILPENEIEYCVCSFEQNQPENFGDYYLWQCDESYKNDQKTYPKEQSGTYQNGHTCGREKVVCVGFVNAKLTNDSSTGHYGVCMTSENGPLGDDLIFAYAQRSILVNLILVKSISCLVTTSQAFGVMI